MLLRTLFELKLLLSITAVCNSEKNSREFSVSKVSSIFYNFLISFPSFTLVSFKNFE